MTATDLLQWMYDTPLGTGLAESLYLYPLIEAVHLLSLAFSFGLILFTDLRLAGVFLTAVPVSQILQQLRPWLLWGFVVTFVSGVLLTFALGPELLENLAFPLKLGLILLAGLNAVWFEWRFGRPLVQGAGPEVVPAGARLAGWSSLFLWSGVAVCGRLIPYLS